MNNDFDTFDTFENTDWITTHSHPWSGLKFQEGVDENGKDCARVLEDTHEIVSPSLDVDSVRKQFWARVHTNLRLTG